jgi:ubiquinone/menaquinone biosynthesis C-methylase UbiE
VVTLADELGAQAGVNVVFHHGDANAMPFAFGQFDLIVCQVAFKNFERPLSALNECIGCCVQAAARSSRT